MPCSSDERTRETHGNFAFFLPVGGFAGASLLAMVVNEIACLQNKRSALESITSKLAPTKFVKKAGTVFYESEQSALTALRHNAGIIA
ncbi:hypothetical protein EMIT0P253_260079 [Pseudomonas sp. IT-P253]